MPSETEIGQDFKDITATYGLPTGHEDSTQVVTNTKNSKMIRLEINHLVRLLPSRSLHGSTKLGRFIVGPSGGHHHYVIGHHLKSHHNFR